ncbi:MAG: TRAP transporter substrate-binding protein [Dehalococcoidia bacterium]|nr:TRAP transporter substrate-binding protein [Dehalococcoidia bacterium]
MKDINRKAIWLMLMVAVLLLPLIAAACGGEATPAPAPAPVPAPAAAPTPAPQKITLKAAHFVPESHPVHPAFIHFAEGVKERSKGQVEIEIFPTGTLLKGREMLEGVRRGVVDMSLVTSAYFQGDFPFTADAGVLPFGWTWDTMDQVSDALRPIFTAELSLHNAKNLYLLPTNIEWYMAKRMDPNNPDWSGMTLRSAGGTFDRVVETFGGTPASMPSGEIAMAVRTGVIEAFMTSLGSYAGRDMWKDAPYIYDTQMLLNLAAGWAVNQDTWDSLSPDLQQIFLEEAKEAERVQVQLSREADDVILEQARQKMAAGEAVELITLTPEQRQIWKNKLQPVWDGFLKKHGQRGQLWVDTVNKISGTN